MKSRRTKLLPVCQKQGSPAPAGTAQDQTPSEPPFLVVRTERRSWITIVFTGFGALLLRYLKTIRERRAQKRK